MYIFGTDGLVTHDNAITFEAAVDNVRRDIISQGPADFQEYFENRVCSLLHENAVAGKNGWTNNNCECLNHVLKHYTQWRMQKIPDLVDKLRELVDAQFLEADRAIVGRGDFMLAPSHAKHWLTVDVWTSMSATQRDKAAKACFRLPGPSTVTSTDGELTVPSTPGAGKKPHQRKRRRVDRMVTVKVTHHKPSDTDDDFE